MVKLLEKDDILNKSIKKRFKESYGDEYIVLTSTKKYYKNDIDDILRYEAKSHWDSYTDEQKDFLIQNFNLSGAEHSVNNFNDYIWFQSEEILDSLNQEFDEYYLNSFKEAIDGDFNKEELDIIEIVSNHFGVTDIPYNGPTFILPNGKFLDIRNCTHHSDVEKWLIDNGYSSFEYIKTAGSTTLYQLGCIRCDIAKYYISLPFDTQPTGEQYNSLLVWLDYLQRFHSAVEVITPDDQHKMYYFDSDTISDTVVDKIRAYYYSGILREAKDCDTVHAKDFVYKRNPIGSVIVPGNKLDLNDRVKTESIWGNYIDYDPKDGWTEEDIELHKSIDWTGRNYEEYPVEEDSFMHNAVLYGVQGGPIRKEVKFIKYIRSNPIYPPYYGPVDRTPFDVDVDYVGPMYDGFKHGRYDIHDRFETQETYDLLSH